MAFSTTDAPLEVDADEFLENEYANSEFTDTTSLTSSITNYVYENGRRYSSYRSGKYLLPNDTAEQDRLDHFHHVWRLLMKGATHLAPLEDPKMVLDIGTGTGIWAIDFADEYPNAQIEGTDLSPIQPAWCPPNVRFVVDDVLDVWTYPKSHFDYIHCRSLVGSIPDWKTLIQKAYDHLKPGGYFEFQDADGNECLYSEDRTYDSSHPLAKVMHHMVTAADKVGQPWVVLPHILDYFRDAGFEIVKHDKLRMPIGTWPKDKRQKNIGAHGIVLTKNSIEPHALALLTRVLGMSEGDARKIIKDAITGINARTHLIMRLESIVVRKPLSAKC